MQVLKKRRSNLETLNEKLKTAAEEFEKNKKSLLELIKSIAPNL